MRVLELFSGTHSIGVVCKELGYDVVSLDRDLGDKCKLNPEYVSPHHIQEDILKWDYTIFPEGHFDIITSSPVCCVWSNLRKCHFGKVLKGYTEPFGEKVMWEDIDKYGKPMVDKVLEIIEYFKPKYWWIENPKTSLMWKYLKEARPQYTNYITLDYCMFSDYGYRKPTTFLSNIPNLEDVKCNKKCGNTIDGLHNGNLGCSRYAIIDGVARRLNSQSIRDYCKERNIDVCLFNFI